MWKTHLLYGLGMLCFLTVLGQTERYDQHQEQFPLSSHQRFNWLESEQRWEPLDEKQWLFSPEGVPQGYRYYIWSQQEGWLLVDDVQYHHDASGRLSSEWEYLLHVPDTAPPELIQERHYVYEESPCGPVAVNIRHHSLGIDFLETYEYDAQCRLTKFEQFRDHPSGGWKRLEEVSYSYLASQGLSRDIRIRHFDNFGHVVEGREEERYDEAGHLTLKQGFPYEGDDFKEIYTYNAQEQLVGFLQFTKEDSLINWKAYRSGNYEYDADGQKSFSRVRFYYWIPDQVLALEENMWYSYDEAGRLEREVAEVYQLWDTGGRWVNYELTYEYETYCDQRLKSEQSTFTFENEPPVFHKKNTYGYALADLCPEPAAPELRIYPNPVRNLLTIEGSFLEQGATLLRLIDSQGRVIWEHSLFRASSHRFRTTELLAGCYYLQLIGEQQQVSRKLLVRK
jgi:hypothetical protein